MKAIQSLLRFQIGSGDIDTFLLRVAQVVCFLVAAFVFVTGLMKIARLDLAEAQLFSLVLQVVQTALLFCILGLFLHPKSSAT